MIFLYILGGLGYFVGVCLLMSLMLHIVEKIFGPMPPNDDYWC